MSIKYAILGFLSWEPLTGYDLKKRFAESEVLYWSGNNNQIYRALVELHQDGWVTQAIHDQPSGPSRKVYTITGRGLAELRAWVMTVPEPPQLRSPFLVQLAWADQLGAGELDDLLAAYEDEVRVKLLMLREQAQRAPDAPDRTPREVFLWRAITAHVSDFYERELEWVLGLRGDLSTRSEG
jgi:PadR family transcriptional regulator AphA